MLKVIAIVEIRDTCDSGLLGFQHPMMLPSRAALWDPRSSTGAAHRIRAASQTQQSCRLCVALSYKQPLDQLCGSTAVFCAFQCRLGQS
jgi:hypothetical protein